MRTDSPTLWHLLDAALQVKNPCNVGQRWTVRTQLTPMNGLRSDHAARAVRTWFRRAAGSVEDWRAQLFEEIHKEVVDVTADLMRCGLGEALSPPWAEWTHHVPGA